MVWNYSINELVLGAPSHHGHVVYPNAQYVPPDSKEQPRKIIYKKNKLEHKHNSSMEVAFSQLARLFLRRGLTAPQKLVKDETNNIIGLATEHMCYVIAEQEGLQKTFFTLDNPELHCAPKAAKVSKEEEIPYYFFDHLPKDFFYQILKAQQAQTLTVDYDSLANFLASSHFLEEDDLHRGNFGFYLIEKMGKPHAVFFKIDHDLMFTQSIMSFYAFRPSNLYHLGNAFAITAQDLINFPALVDSANHYWPTKINYFPNPWSSKLSLSSEEAQAFAHLAQVPEFKKAKWRAFLKHIITPMECIDWSLKESLDEHNPIERANAALITHAVTARQAELRAVLFSIKEFREFLVDLSDEEYNALVTEQKELYPKDSNLDTVKESMKHYRALAQSAVFEGDTPLHSAIRLGDYRYEETWENFSKFINVKNAAGETPLDIALAAYRAAPEGNEDIRKHAGFIVDHLIKHGATKPLDYDSGLEQKLALLQRPYTQAAAQLTTYQELKDMLHTIGEDHRYCLKTKKITTVECIKEFIKVHKNHPDLATMLGQLRREVNGDGDKEACASLKYIRQLRSRLWIVRQIRGLFGHSSTLSEINSLVDGAIARTQAKNSNYYSFFNWVNTSLPQEVEGGLGQEIPCI